MPTVYTFLFFFLLLSLSALAHLLCRRVHIPYYLLLIVIGFVGSELATGYFNIDILLRWENVGTVIFYALLPIFIYTAAIRYDLSLLRKNILILLCLVIPGAVITILVTAFCIYAGINSPSGFPLIAAFLVATLLLSTDSALASVILKRRNGGFIETRNLLKGESLFNDTTSVVLFSFILALAMGGDFNLMSWREGFFRLVCIFLCGSLMGMVFGLLFYVLQKWVVDVRMRILLELIFAYGSFIVSEQLLEFSGVLSVLFTGLVVGRLHAKLSTSEREFSSISWDFLSLLVNTLIFLIGGITITLTMFYEQWLAMLIAILAILFARLCTVIVLELILRWFHSGWCVLNIRDKLMILLGGMRGPITLALALSLPLSLDYWYSVQSMAYGVVIYTLFIQSILMEWVLSRWKVRESK